MRRMVEHFNKADSDPEERNDEDDDEDVGDIDSLDEDDEGNAFVDGKVRAVVVAVAKTAKFV